MRHGRALTRAAGGDDDEVLGAIALASVTGSLIMRRSGMGSGGDPAVELASLLVTMLHPPAPAVVESTWCPSAPILEPLAEDGPRAALVAAGRRVFPELGYDATRIADVVAAAGMAQGTFYRYFDDKADLFAAVALEAAEPMLALLGDLVTMGPDGAVESWAGAWFSRYAEHGPVFSVWAERGADAALTPAVVELALGRVRDTCRRADGPNAPEVHLALLALVEWAPYLVHRFPAFGRRRTERAMAELLIRVLEPGVPGEGGTR